MIAPRFYNYLKLFVLITILHQFIWHVFCSLCIAGIKQRGYTMIKKYINLSLVILFSLSIYSCSGGGGDGSTGSYTPKAGEVGGACIEGNTPCGTGLECVNNICEEKAVTSGGSVIQEIACSDTEPCSAGYYCENSKCIVNTTTTTTTTASSTTSDQLVKTVWGGEDCDDLNNICIVGSKCVSGKCVGDKLLTPFAITKDYKIDAYSNLNKFLKLLIDGNNLYLLVEVVNDQGGKSRKLLMSKDGGKNWKNIPAFFGNIGALVFTSKGKLYLADGIQLKSLKDDGMFDLVFNFDGYADSITAFAANEENYCLFTSGYYNGCRLYCPGISSSGMKNLYCDSRKNNSLFRGEGVLVGKKVYIQYQTPDNLLYKSIYRIDIEQANLTAVEESIRGTSPYYANNITVANDRVFANVDRWKDDGNASMHLLRSDTDIWMAPSGGGYLEYATGSNGIYYGVFQVPELLEDYLRTFTITEDDQTGRGMITMSESALGTRSITGYKTISSFKKAVFVVMEDGVFAYVP